MALFLSIIITILVVILSFSVISGIFLLIILDLLNSNEVDELNKVQDTMNQLDKHNTKNDK